MLTLKELRQLRATKAARGKAALTELNAINAKGAEASAEELAKVATLEAELQALETEVPASTSRSPSARRPTAARCCSRPRLCRAPAASIRTRP
jgi:hypothetical protein